jgi:hypothetical protein
MKEIVSIEQISGRIYFIRGQRVMLDRDLAELYGVETKRLKEQVRRNIDRFPDDFMFELTKNEFEILRSQFASSSWGGLRYAPMAFTEHGVLMISSVLKNDKAVQVNIQIMRVFIKFRAMLSAHKDLDRKIEEMERKYNNRFQIVFETLDQLINVKDKQKKKIGFTVKEKLDEYGKKAKIAAN